MANRDHVAILTNGAGAWNAWRANNPEVIPDLRGIQVPSDVQVSGTLAGANFRRADLSGFIGLGSDRDWSGSVPSMEGADFLGANLTGAHFWRVTMEGASFRDAVLDRAEFEQTNLERAQMVGTSVLGATFRKVSVYGIAAWDIK